MKWRSRLCKSPKSFPCQKAFSGTPTRHPCISNETRMCSHQSLCLRPLCCSLWCFLSPFSLKVCALKPRFREKKKFQCASVLYRFNLCMNGVCAKLCPILCDPRDFSPPGSSVPGLSQARYWSGLLVPPPGDWTPVSWVSCIARQVLYRWATWVTNLKLLTLCHRNKRWTCLDLKFCFCLFVPLCLDIKPSSAHSDGGCHFLRASHVTSPFWHSASLTGEGPEYRPLQGVVVVRDSE